MSDSRPYAASPTSASEFSPPPPVNPRPPMDAQTPSVAPPLSSMPTHGPGVGYPAAGVGYPAAGVACPPPGPTGLPGVAYPAPGAYFAPPAAQPRLFLPTKLKDSIRFYQVPARPWWWGLIMLATYVGCYLVVQIIAGLVLFFVDPEFTAAALNHEEITTPTLFLVNNIAIALDIVVCTALSWAFFRQGFGWLVSVVGRFRWKWLGIALGVFAAGYAIQMIVEIIVYTPEGYGFGELEITPHTWFMLAAILLTTPFQCAGEEFQSRALLARTVAAIVPFRVVGLILSAAVPSTIFMFLHGAEDPWLNLNYFCVALMMWWLAYRTGGIEASIALHVVNNLFSEWYLPFTDISDMFDRSEGTGSAWVLVGLGVQLALVLLVDMIARRRGVARLSAPAASTPQVVKPRKWITRLKESTQVATKADLPRLETTARELSPTSPLMPSPLFHAEQWQQPAWQGQPMTSQPATGQPMTGQPWQSPPAGQP